MRRLATSLLILVLAAGCTTARRAHDPDRNENARNLLAASFFCSILHAHGFLPGVSATQRGKIEVLGRPAMEAKAAYPWQIDLRLKTESEPTAGYWYTVRKASAQAPWYLAKAWKGDSTGRIVIGALPLPTNEQILVANDELKALVK